MSAISGYTFQTCFGSVYYPEETSYDQMRWSNAENNYARFLSGIQECMYPNKSKSPASPSERVCATITSEKYKLSENNEWKKHEAPVSVDMVNGESGQAESPEFVTHPTIIGSEKCKIQRQDVFPEYNFLEGTGLTLNEPVDPFDMSEFYKQLQGIVGVETPDFLTAAAELENFTIQPENLNFQGEENFPEKNVVDSTENLNGLGKPEASVPSDMLDLYNQPENCVKSKAAVTEIENFTIQPENLNIEGEENFPENNFVVSTENSNGLGKPEASVSLDTSTLYNQPEDCDKTKSAVTEIENFTIQPEIFNIQGEENFPEKNIVDGTQMALKENSNGLGKPEASVLLDMSALNNQPENCDIAKSAATEIENFTIQLENLNIQGEENFPETNVIDGTDMAEKENSNGLGKPEVSPPLNNQPEDSDKENSSESQTSQIEIVKKYKRKEKFLKKKCSEGTTAALTFVRRSTNGSRKPKSFIELNMAALFSQLKKNVKSKTPESETTPIDKENIESCSEDAARQATEISKENPKVSDKAELMNQAQEDTEAKISDAAVNKTSSSVPLKIINVAGRMIYICCDCEKKRKQIAILNGVL